jgi:hypothetical protein
MSSFIQKLLDAGYKEHLSWRDNCRFFQKGINDNKGKKYSIESYYYNIHNHIGCTFKIQTETDKGTVELETVQWFNDCDNSTNVTIEEVEELFEKFWLFCGSNYYERYENETNN